MKIVFLDIDGVLNSKPFFDRELPGGSGTGLQLGVDWSLRFDPKCVALLQRILDETGAVVVISSAWRNDTNIVIVANERRTSTTEIIASFLHSRGAPQANVIGACPSGFDRGPSILEWRRLNGHEGMFVCLDDCLEMGPAEPFTVRTTPAEGLTEELAARAIIMLSSP